jgi:hypothetical protein
MVIFGILQLDTGHFCIFELTMNAAAVKKKLADGSLSREKLSDLKAYLKSVGQSQSGEKPSLILRIDLHVQSRGLQVNGVDPFLLKPGDLRKAVAARGMNPMGDKDELMELLVKRLVVESGAAPANADGAAGAGGGGGGGGGGGAPSAASKEAEAARIADLVLELDDNYAGILSVLSGAGSITPQSTTASMKKEYLKLAR